MSVLSAEAVAKLEAVRDAILTQPELYDQSRYCGEEDPCNSPCCIAGWAVWNDSPARFRAIAEKPWSQNWIYAANKALRLPDSWEFDGTWLFRDPRMHWQAGFGAKFVKARTYVGCARVAADYINFLIERDGPKSEVSA